MRLSRRRSALGDDAGKLKLVLNPPLSALPRAVPVKLSADAATGAVTLVLSARAARPSKVRFEPTAHDLVAAAAVQLRNDAART